MKKFLQSVMPIAVLTTTLFAKEAIITLQNGLDKYSGCQDRSLFEKKVSTAESKWAGAMAGAYPEMKVHGIEANSGDCEKLALGQLVC